MTKLLSLLLFSLPLILVSQAGAQTTYWVSKTGSDTNGGTNGDADSFLTIQRGVSALGPGDTLNVRSGIYADDGGASPYRPAGLGAGLCGWIASSSNVCINSNGTPGNPITIQAAPGEEGQAIIDGQGDKVAIHLQSSDYVRIRGFSIVNSWGRGIASWGQAGNHVADPTRLSIGVVVENNSIENTKGPWGTNVSAIAMWGSQDWVVRNNYINSVEELNTNGIFNRLGNGIQSYGVINALVENNFIENINNGVYWKDHFVEDLATRTSVVESEIRYNVIQASGRPVFIGISGSGSPEAGENYIRNNILYGQSGAAGVHVAMAGAFAQSAKVRIENNLIDGEGNSNSEGINVDASEDISVTGNIITRTASDAVYTAFSSSTAAGRFPVLNESDYNIYENSFRIIADRYSSTVPTQNFNTLSAWQAKLASEIVSLNVDNPDTNSITADPSSLFIDLANKDYRNAPGSPALGFMPDGSNAGPYQTGHEIIGLLPNWPQYVIPEPTSAVLSVLAAIGLFAGRGRSRR